jgi:hypothetical protein
MLMRRPRAIVMSLAIAVGCLGPAPADAEPAGTAGTFRAADAGYFGCVTVATTLRSTYCFAATRNAGTTHVAAAFRRGAAEPQIVEADLPGSVFARRPDIGPFVVQFRGDVPIIGTVDLVIDAETTVSGSQDHTCLAHPVQYSALSPTLDGSAIGTFITTHGTIAGEPVGSYSFCETTILGDASGYWALTHT